ncbi:MAG: hypothetical protein JNJ69_16520, partial [Leptospiraceae bacterium]|nr:hypothetical protein [Leptospiraceae bacterium]
DDLVFADTRRELSEKYPQAIWGNALSKEGIAPLRTALSQRQKADALVVNS